MFVKLGEAIAINGIEDTNSCTPVVSEDILENFRKFATNLKKIAPKADDFLYFSAIMLHAAEASAINDDGSPKRTASGEPVKVSWDTSNGTWRWVSNDPNIKAYKNSNGDIFPECELVKAHRLWVGKPLCIDHQSSSVDHVRGFIVDTYYDRNLKRVIGLCALDKQSYPDLARKVSTGYSNSVSMGTGVSQAICYDCGKVARVEQEFCSHMKSKSCYGEINVGLNPIELSIVVNPADPKAHIKNVIAAANALNSYVNSKSAEMKKISERNFSAEITVNDNTNDANKSNKISINSTDLDKFKLELDGAFEKLQELNGSVIDFSKNDTNNLALNNNSDVGLSPPHERFASNEGHNDASIKELHEITKNIEKNLEQIKEAFNHLTEEKMSKDLNKQGYFQGTEEPTPGQAKYPKDPTQEKLRLNEDKQMVGQHNQDTGPIDGLHPGPESAGVSELERKKMLARAEAEERTLRRAAVVKAAKDKVGYFQGGGGANEPTPGKPKYPKERLNEDLREHGDKQMVGQKPFPGVGAVDGLHPSPDSADVADEKKRKELLQRASLRARFVKNSNTDGSQNLGSSAWEVFMGDKLLLTASVNDLSGGKADLLYDSIATKEFGAKLIEKVKVQGAEKVASVIKKAQEVPAPAPEMAAAPAEAAPPVNVPADVSAEGDPKANVAELAEKVRDLSSDMVEAVRALTGEQAEMGDEMAVAASDLNSVRKELNSELTEALKETVEKLAQHQEELDMISGMYDKGSINNTNADVVGTIVEDALSEAKTTIAEGTELLSSFVKYARGTKEMLKRAEIEAELKALAEGDEDMDANDADDLMNLINDTNADLDAVKDMMSADDKEDEDNADMDEDEASDENDIKAKPEELKDLEVKPGSHVEVVASFDTKEGRAALRAKLAADTVKYNPILHDAHPKGGFTIDLDSKPTGDLAKVEDLEEKHDAMLDVATAPVKVRKEAEAIHKLVSEGKLEVSDLDALVAEGLDKDAVAYYRKYFGQTDGGSEFASELVKEHVKAQMEEELNTYKVKVARAYELAYDMAARGLCHNDRESVAAEVENIMKCNDESFESLKRVVARHSLQKKATFMPQVGSVENTYSEYSKVEPQSLQDELAAALNTSKRRNF